MNIKNKTSYIVHLSEELSTEVGRYASDNIKIKDIPDRPVDIYLERCKGLEEYFNLLHQTAKIYPDCRQKCSACCRYPIWAYEIEFIAINEWIEKHFSIEKKDRLNFNLQEWKKKIDSLALKPNPHDIKSGYRYTLEKLYCPFLLNNNCSIYEVRPMVCRIYFSYGKAGDCISQLYPNETVSFTCAYYNIYLNPAEKMINEKFKENSEAATEILSLLKNEKRNKMLPFWFLD